MMRTIRWGLALVVAAAVAADARPPSVNPEQAGISARVALTQLGFSPVKKPKVKFVPHAGQTITKSVGPKVLSFTSTEIDVQVTSGLAGVYDVLVTPRDKGVAPVTLPDTFTLLAPEPASVDPTSGPWKTLVTIHGADFGAPKGKVTIGGKNAAVRHWADDTIRCLVPTRLAAGDCPVVVKNKAGASDGSLVFQCEGKPPKPGTKQADEWIRADLSGKGHFACDNATPSFVVAWNPTNAQLTFGGTSQPLKGFPDLDISILPLDVTLPMPYDITTSPQPPLASLATLQYTENATSGVAIHTASLGAVGSSLTVTITAWDGTFLDGTFTGTLVDTTGKTSPIVVTNGVFRTRRETGH